MGVNISRDDFQELLDEEEVTICGITHNAGWLLRRADPVAFDEMYWTYVHSVEQAIEEEAV